MRKTIKLTSLAVALGLLSSAAMAGTWSVGVRFWRNQHLIKV